MWERLGRSDRFSFVDHNKVEHVVMDDGVDMDKVSRVKHFYRLVQHRMFSILLCVSL